MELDHSIQKCWGVISGDVTLAYLADYACLTVLVVTSLIS